jgi:glutathione peroxidase-family protein
MRFEALGITILALLAGCGGGGTTGSPEASGDGDDALAEPDGAGGGGTGSAYVLDHTMELIDGTPKELASYEGQVVLMVNVASRCGFTRQYAGLQELYEDHADEGFVILGFPANNFGGQEPGSNEEIAAFCSDSFGVTFPMFAKISVKGSDQHALYRQLSGQPKPIGGDPKWNFTKFLVDRSGNVVGRFGSSTGPKDPALVSEVQRLLASGGGDDASG